MKKLSQLLESINEVNSLLELDFKDKEAFQKYQAKHKMKPTTKINIAGKDTTVGDEMGDDSEKPQAPKKTTGADIEKQADKSGKEKSDIEKDIMGDEPKSDEPVKLDDYGQEAIDGVKWNKYDVPTGSRVDIAGTVINDFDDYVEEWNSQIQMVASELEGQIPDEDLDKLYSAEINTMDMDDEALSEVPKEELEKKAKALADIHKKYSTIGKKQADKSDEPKSEPKKKGTGLKKPSSLDSYYAKEDAKKKWLASNPGKTDYDWSRLPYGTMSDLIDKEMRAKGFKENFDLRQLSKITTRYTNRLDERTKIRGANNKMVEVPKSYVDKTGKFAYRFYKTSGMGGDLTSDVKLGYQRYHKIPPNDEFSGSVILKKDAMDVKKKDINLVMNNLKKVAKQNGINLYIMKYVPDRNDPFIEFKMRIK